MAVRPAQPGQLKLDWRPIDGCRWWWGRGCDKTDGIYLHYALSRKRTETRLSQPVTEDGERLIGEVQDGGLRLTVIESRSILDELKARGYDLTTLRITIRKSAPPSS